LPYIKCFVVEYEEIVFDLNGPNGSGFIDRCSAEISI
jgi:hypothetical protein